MTEKSRKGWIPEALVQKDEQMLVRWRFAGDTPFHEPFFEETLLRLRHRSNGINSPAEFSPLDEIRSGELEAAVPAAVIFHVSRCGSTLLSQLLTLDEKNIVLAEVPVFDQVLQLKYFGEDEKEKYFRELLAFYLQRRRGTEERGFIKADSWHIHRAGFFRRLFPELPFVFLYREPAAVLQSHRRKRGMHMVPGMVELPVTYSGEPLDEYAAKVLSEFYAAGLGLAQNDPHTFLVNYGSGLPGALLDLLRRWGLAPDGKLQEKMLARASFHSKSPGEKFSAEEKEPLPEGGVFLTLVRRYEALEEIRTATENKK